MVIFRVIVAVVATFGLIAGIGGLFRPVPAPTDRTVSCTQVLDGYIGDPELVTYCAQVTGERRRLSGLLAVMAALALATAVVNRPRTSPVAPPSNTG